MVPSLKRLGSEIATAQDEELRAFDMQAQRARLLARASQKKRPTRALLVGLAFAAALALFWLWSRPAPLAFSVAGGPGERGKWISAPVGARTSLDFSDGSVLTLEGGARARVTSLDAQGAHVVLERGALSASVIHRAATRYQIDAGPFEVHVIGTRFEVAWDPERQAFSLSLEEGAVRVSGPSIDERVVSAGETFAVSLANAAEPATPVSAAALASSEATSTRPAPEREASASSTVARTSPAPIDQAPVEPAWRMLHLKGEHKAAWALIEAEGVDGVIERASASDLAILADIARFARKPQYATLALKSLRARFPTDPAAADAAFLLGRLAFDQGGSASGAAAWFSTYLAERPNGVFAREAAGRLVECFARSGDTERAKAAAKQYLANYPNGPHAAVARRVLEGTAPTAPDAPNARMPEQETREP